MEEIASLSCRPVIVHATLEFLCLKQFHFLRFHRLAGRLRPHLLRSHSPLFFEDVTRGSLLCFPPISRLQSDGVFTPVDDDPSDLSPLYLRRTAR